MRNAKSIKNDNTRDQIDEMVKSTKSGAILFTDDISRALSVRRRSVNNRTAGKLMAEREDVKMRDKNGMAWVKL